MTRKTDGGANASATRAAATLRNLRNQIDKLDLQILKLANERADLAGEIGKVKVEQGLDTVALAREEEVFQHVLEANKKMGGPLSEIAVRAIFREIMSGSRAIQKVPKVSYLGPEYSFSHLAAIEKFGHSVDLMAGSTITAVFEEVNRGQVEFGVVPLENSTDGRIADTLEMFIRLPQIKICGEVRVKIHHHLLANCDPGQIRRVYSKAQALSQCRLWLSKTLPHAQTVEVSSTAFAADLARKETGAAAVASRQAATHFGLNILFSDIQDVLNNETRFAVIGNQKCDRTGHDKTAVMFRVAHSAGTLAEALDVFKQSKLNLLWIESFPYKGGTKPEYIFFVDFEGHVEDTKVAKALKALGEHCTDVTVLGSFPAAPLTG